ncbi:YfcE family phosphodiesterase [Methanobrevibacter curvatus]|uniref:Phosphoesterase n=1 Tax=Methanobrevibacter curvatus TaxID=49547 RepID=A0A166CCC4_9EURY|nr:hypothetical protein MBCUR_05850 [Methanobrevibacter curvatus]
MLVGLISDTHVGDRVKELPPIIPELFKDVDLILHAGDITSKAVLDRLEKIAPTKAVLGNMDSEEELKLNQSEIIEIEEFKVGLNHGTVYPKGDTQQLEYIAMELEVDILVTGHTHQPLIEKANEITLVNPGSPTTPVLADPTVMLMKIEDGKVDFELKKVAEPTCTSIKFANDKLKENEDDKVLFGG